MFIVECFFFNNYLRISILILSKSSNGRRQDRNAIPL